MVKLLLWRHAKTVQQEGLADIDRFLMSQGRKDRQKAARLIEQAHPPDAIICSVAARAQETLEALETYVEAQLSELLYHCHIEDILNILRGIDDAHQTLLLVGHNPSFEDFIRHVQFNEQPPQSELGHKFHPGDLSIIEWAGSSWGNVQMKSARLVEVFSVKSKP